MTAIPLKNIKGCLVSKNKIIPEHLSGMYGDGYKYDAVRDSGFNEAITLMGKIQITLNRERLSKLLWDIMKYDLGIGQNYCNRKADAILNALPELVEVVK